MTTPQWKPATYKLDIPTARATVELENDGRWWAYIAVTGARWLEGEDGWPPLEAAKNAMCEILEAALASIRGLSASALTKDT